MLPTRAVLAGLAALALGVGGSLAAHDLALALPALIGAGTLALISAHGGADRRGWAWILLLLAAAIRIPVVVAPPETSDDVWRYLWEGRVVAAGESPYRFPPESPRLRVLRDPDVHPRINHPEIATIYPPVAEGLFLAGHLVGGTPRAWKLLLLGLELVAAALVLSLDRRRGGAGEPALLFLWNPLLVLESGEAGHVDAAGGALLLLALGWAASPRAGARFGAAVLAGLSVLVKPAALGALPFFARSRAGLAGALAILGLAVALLLPVFREAPGALRGRPGEAAGWLTRAGVSPGPLPRWRGEGAEEIQVEVGGRWCRALPETGGRAALVARSAADGGTAVIASSAEWLEPLADPGRDAGALVGRYALAALGSPPDAPWGFLDFDGRQEVAAVTPDGRHQALRYYVDEEGRVAVWEEGDPPVVRAELGLSADRQALRGLIRAWPGFGEGLEAVGLRAQDDPLTGSRQYGGRWAGFSLLHRPLERLLGGRGAVTLAGAALMALLCGALWVRRAPLPVATTATTLLAVSLLPVVYPWYFLWVLGGAAHLRAPRWRRGLALLLALTPLLHLG